MRAVTGVVSAALVIVMLALPPRAALATDGSPARIIDNLYGTSLVDPNTGWIVGAFGMIARTRDGAKTWEVQKSGTLEHVFAVDFVDAVNGWAVGRSGLILHTTNAGESWQLQKSPVDQHLFSVAALSAQRAVAVGDWGTIVRTVDGGNTWQPAAIDRDVILNAQAWPDAEHGWIVGEAGTVLVTRDGGATWQDQPTGVDKTLFGTFFADASKGWIVGLDGIILNTTDGGANWVAQRGDTEVGMLDQVGAKAGVENPSLYDVAVVGQLGYAVGEGSAVFASEDGGATWQRKAVPAAANLRWIRALSLVPGHGMLVGANGLTLRVDGTEMSFPGK